MRTGIKIYGTLRGIDTKGYEKLKPHLIMDEVSMQGREIVLEHSGPCGEVEDLLPLVMEVMGKGYESNVDIIDHDANMIIRYAVFCDGFRARELNMDDVVEAYPHS